MNVNRAFIFDMDGVIVDSEAIWEEYESIFLSQLFGEKIYDTIRNDVLGNAISVIHKVALEHGSTIDKQFFLDKYDEYAEKVYQKAVITSGMTELIDILIHLQYKLAIVSASPLNWIQIVLKKLNKGRVFDCIISLNDHPTLRPKPLPDGYIEAIKLLGSTANSTIIMEDSNRGLQSAKASGAYTIGLKENLPKSYHQEQADMNIDKLIDLHNFDFIIFPQNR